MTDEFNLVPTNNLEKHLDNILRSASGEEPQYDLVPNWRVEQYLAAITKKLSEGGSGGGGNIFIVNATFAYDENDGWSVTLDKTYAEMSAAGEAGKTLLCVAWYEDFPHDVKPINYNAFDGVGSTVDVSLGSRNMCKIGWYQEEGGDPIVEEVLDWSKSGGVLVVTDTEGTLDKTWQEIHDAMTNGIVKIQGDNPPTIDVVTTVINDSEVPAYVVITLNGGEYTASSADGYPSQE